MQAGTARVQAAPLPELPDRVVQPLLPPGDGGEHVQKAALLQGAHIGRQPPGEWLTGHDRREKGPHRRRSGRRNIGGGEINRFHERGAF